MQNQPNTLADQKEHKFILFVSGMSVKSTLSIDNLRNICEDHLADNFDIQIIDVTRDKAQANDYQLIGIPALIRTTPLPPKMILGDLSDRQNVLRILDI